MSFVDVKNVFFHYRKTDESKEPPLVLDDLSLKVEKGSFVGILGDNGSGKSTLAKHLAALLEPARGTIWVGGLSTSVPENVLPIRQKLGIVFQNPDNQILSNVVEEDIAFGMENLGISSEEMRQRIRRVLEMTKLTAYRTANPSALSGGQKQKVAISGVLAMEPECIVFDEATSMIDPESRGDLLGVVRDLHRLRHMTVIFITHFPKEVMEADRLYVMERGRVSFAGTPAELFSDLALPGQLHLEIPYSLRLRAFLRHQGMAIPDEVMTPLQLLPYLREAGIRTLPPISISDDDNTAGTAPGSAASPEGIRLRHVSYAYESMGRRPSQKAVSDVSLAIGHGESVAIIGRTGSGKSTLIQMANGLIRPQNGSCCFEGEDIWAASYPLRDLRFHVGLCFQYPDDQLFEETVLKDIAFGPANMGLGAAECDRRAREAMRLTGLPADLETVSPLSLSGGQKRRCALAGVLAMEPDFLILDEPAAGMDFSGKKQLFGLLRNIRESRGVTVIFVTHSMEDARRYADRILVMDRGSIAMDGSPEEVFGDPERLYELGMALPEDLAIKRALETGDASCLKR